MTHHLEPWEPQHLDVVVLFKRSIPFWWYQKVRTYPSTKVLTSNGGSDRLVLGSNPGNVTNMNTFNSLNILCGIERTERNWHIKQASAILQGGHAKFLKELRGLARQTKAFQDFSTPKKPHLWSPRRQHVSRAPSFPAATERLSVRDGLKSG
jgi:hypothetical protein